MKTVIFYSSIYNGNTLKIAESMAATLSADLIATLFPQHYNLIFFIST